MTMPGRIFSASSRSGGSFPSWDPNCCASKPTRGRGCCSTGWPRNSPARLNVNVAELAAALHPERRRVLVPRRPRPARGGLRAPARHHQRRQLRAARRRCAGSPRSRTSICSSPPPSIRCSRWPSTWSDSTARPRPRCWPTRPTASSILPCERDRAAAAGRLPSVRQALGLADLRDLGRGSARVHLRAAERASGSREAVPRARAQSSAVHRQQLHQLAGAAVPAHGEASAAVRPPRRGRSARRRSQQRRTIGWWPSCSRSACAPASTWAPNASSTSCTRRWQARRRARREGSPAAAPARFLPPAREMPDNAVFISYAREDLPAVQQIKAGLEAAGITTWFDMDRLEAGDDYDRKIQRNIARCSYFIPVVSATTQRRLEAYFRREWSYAHRPRAQHGRRRAVHPAGDHRRHERGRGAGARQVQGAALHHLPGGEVPRGICAAAARHHAGAPA